MSINKFISKICNLPVPLKIKDVPSYSMLRKAFLHMHSKIKKSQSRAFRFNEDEVQVLLLALENAVEHRYLEVENDCLYELAIRVNKGRDAYSKEGGGHNPTGKAARKMVKIIGVQKKKLDWSCIYSDFLILKEETTIKKALIKIAKRYAFSNLSSLIQGLRRHGAKSLPSHSSEFATKPIFVHNTSIK
ncbi:MAG: hypothetical protein P8M70_11700 [Verrucomicrobiota bacterium]|nr:hypothetical protein [Verrucomicrobiota bacterium]